MPTDKATVRYAVDLLKAHQLRRENTFLYQKIQDLQGEFATLRDEGAAFRENVAQMQTKTEEIAHNLQQSTTDISILKDATNEAKDTARQAAHQAETLQNEFQNMVASIDMKHVDVESEVEKLEQIVGNTLTGMEQKHQALELRVSALAIPKEHGTMMLCLNALQNRVTALENKNRIAVAEPVLLSMGKPGYGEKYMMPFDGLIEIYSPSGTNTNLNVAAVKNTVIESAETEQPTPLPAQHELSIGRQLNDSMIDPRRGTDSQLVHLPKVSQGRFQSWEDYLAEYQALVDIHPRTWEVEIVHTFIEGIHNERLRRECQQWLSVNGLKWENVKLYSSQCSQAVLDDNQRKASHKAITTTEPASIVAVQETQMSETVSQQAVGEENIHLAPDTVPIILRRSRRIAEQHNDAPKLGYTIKRAVSKVPIRRPKSKMKVHVDEVVTRSIHQSEVPDNNNLNVSQPARQRQVLGNLPNVPKMPLQYHQSFIIFNGDTDMESQSTTGQENELLPQCGRPTKRTKLPLPPPPEIPILSTSTDDDYQMDFD